VLGYSLGVTESASCAVCTAPAAVEAFELSFCQSCFDDPAQAPGPQIDISHNVRPKIEQITVTHVHDVQVRVQPAKAAQVSVKFSAEHIGHKLVKVFKEEYQAGEAAFDDAIYIADQHRDSTVKLLDRAGAREAIITLVSGHNHVDIAGGVIDFRASDEGATDLLTYLRAALALSCHIGAIA
jgi:hypothetical protein